MRERLRDYVLLVVVSCAVTLPGLGRYSLWDVDEGVNAEAAREMAEADSWVVPTFNYALRTAKPVLLYWLQRISYAVWGVSEWGARLPSAVCGLAAVLLCYELGRRLWDRATGLWGGLILGTAVQFVVLARAATPDAPLLLCTVLAFWAFWSGQRQGGRGWWHATAAACGWAVLTKGPVGVVLPALVVVMYLAWQRELRRLWDVRLITAAGVFLLVAGPWYALVASETRGEWVRAFIGRENLERFARPMEGHRGPPFYYLLVLPVMFAPWSVWLLPTLEQAWRQGWGQWRRGWSVLAQQSAAEEAGPYRFLLCWLAAYLVIFSIAATKLPNYIFPLYPALALLTARLLVRWQSGTLELAGWVVPVAAGLLGLAGLAVSGGLVVAERWCAGLWQWAWVGLLLTGGAGAAFVAWRAGKRPAVLRCVAVAAVLFATAAAIGIPLALDRQRAPRPLAWQSGAADPSRDLRVGAYRWFAPSLVFYTGRQVQVLADAAGVRRFLEIPTPAYLFVPAAVWEREGASWPAWCVARRADLLARGEIVVVANAAAQAEAAQRRQSKDGRAGR